MDKISSLNLDIDRVLLQLIIPGLTATFPWLIIFTNHHQKDLKLILENSSLLVTIVVIVSLVAGIILENIGSQIEVNHYDKKNKKKDNEYIKIWEEYLKLNYDGKEPIGHRYIRNILLRMKFELSFGIALIPMAVGLSILDYQSEIFKSCIYKCIFFLIIPAATFIYLIFYEGYKSSKVLAETRKLLVIKYTKPTQPTAHE
jgi:hypothetical protein